MAADQPIATGPSATGSTASVDPVAPVAGAATAHPPSGWRLIARALRNRKLALTLTFGFSAGLPYALLLGTLYAWLGEAGVDLETMGVFSLIGLAYAFKFLWSPLVDRVRLPGLDRLGRRRAWLLPIQLTLGVIFILLSRLDPVTSIGMFSLLAGLGAFASATQDIVIDAWRIDVADEVATVEILSSVYQLGYRLAALAGGALALVMAARVGWPLVFLGAGVLMLVTALATLAAPDTHRGSAASEAAAARLPWLHDDVPPRLRAIGVAIVGLGWGWALFTVITFMARSLTADAASRPDATAFIKGDGPLIVAVTVLVPALVAIWLNRAQARGASSQAGMASPVAMVDHAYRALILPLAEIIGRLGWGAVIALGIILTYRFTDSVWGPFALPFYLEELGYTKDQVAFASKVFGVGMTMAGIAIGAILFAAMGRYPTLVLGAVLAAGTNLLYADLAAGAPLLGGLSTQTGLTGLVTGLGGEARMAPLLLAIAGENLAGGLAGAAFVAYLSSIVSRDYSAVQYALLSSLTLLIGSIGRGALGQAIEVNGYRDVFVVTAALGAVAVVLCLIEWWRVGRSAPAVANPAPAGSA